MFYYAYLNADDICETVYSMPVQITGDDLIYLGTTELNVAGQHYNRTDEQFEPVYYYAVLDDRSVVTKVEWSLTQKQTSDSYRSITFAQYQTVSGLYWNGSDYVIPPISILAKASTDEVNYKSQDKWLSTKLDEMDEAISDNESDISTLSTDLSTVATNLQTVANSLGSLATVVGGKADEVHTHSISDVTDLDDALTALDGEIEDLQTAVAGKAASSHTHSQSEINGLETALSGKSNVNHIHYMSDVTGLNDALNGKAASIHTHSQYATLNAVYPVGSLYLSTSDTNPSTLFGGTWELFGAGRTLLGAAANEDAEETGGSATASIAAHSHTTQGHVLTVSEIPSHHHELLNYNTGGVATETFTKNSVKGEDKIGWTGNVMTSYIGGDGSHSHGDTGSAGAAEISVVQPYITCFIWKRTN